MPTVQIPSRSRRILDQHAAFAGHERLDHDLPDGERREQHPFAIRQELGSKQPARVVASLQDRLRNAAIG